MKERQLRQAKWKELKFDLGSDHHFDLENDKPEEIAAAIRDQRQRTTLMLPGDLFETTKGQDSSRQIVEVLNGLVRGANGYDQVIWVPGNHDLRSQDKPFDRNPKLSDRILSPQDALTPTIIELQGVRILIANLMYDNLVQPEIALTTREAVEDLYRRKTDGKYLLKGDMSLFPKMGEVVRDNLEDVDILVTHVPAHPFAGKIIVGKNNEQAAITARKHGLGIIPEQEAIEEWKTSIARWKKAGGPTLDFEDYARKYWNPKTVLLGTDVLTYNNFEDGLLSIYGHTHRSVDFEKRTVDGKEVNFLSYQPKP